MNCHYLACLLNRWPMLGILIVCVALLANVAWAGVSWQAASRYLLPTPALNRIVARAQERAENIHKADRWDELWDKVLAQPIPDNEPQTQHFLDRQAELLLYMNRSTDVAAIEKAAASLKDEVDAYVKAVTTDMHHVKYRLVIVPMAPAQTQTVSQDNFSEAVDVSSQTRTIQIPAESVPYGYRESMPPELLSRLQKLNNANDIIEEMQAYSAEETRLHNVELQNQMSLPPIQPVPLPLGQHPQTTIQSQDLPLPWRGRTIPPELQERLANLQLQNAPETQIKQTIDGFYIGQGQLQIALKEIRARREVLDRQSVTHPPFNIEIVPETPMPKSAILPLTNALLRIQIEPQRTQ
jgi:hypothetical protein